MLILFEVLSGLKINFSKSSLYASKGALHLKERFAASLGCELGEWPLYCLGHDIRPNLKRKRY